MTGDFQKPIGPFRLRDLKDGLYQIHSKRFGAFEGTYNSIYHQAMKWGIPHTEFTYAIDTLKLLNDDFAEFGVFGRFLFTERNQRVG